MADTTKKLPFAKWMMRAFANSKRYEPIYDPKTGKMEVEDKNMTAKQRDAAKFKEWIKNTAKTI